ncbi:MAG: hypothetical protein QM527_08890, partial [Alphaproteobacteria bacterium]|nr:hypothetical protein [Alphaproteobacteria bacterium]
FQRVKLGNWLRFGCDSTPFTVGRSWKPFPNPVEIDVRSLLLIGNTHPTQDHVRRFAWGQV